MKFNTVLSVVDYYLVTSEIAASYFDESGNFTPAKGRIEILRIFYNSCEKAHEKPIDDVSELNKIVSDADFVNAYNEAIKGGADQGLLSFNYALQDAKAMVSSELENKNNITAQIKGLVVDFVKAIEQSVQEMEKVTTPEVIEDIKKVASGIGDGKNLADSIVDSYIQKGLHSKDGQSTPHADGKVIDIESAKH